MKMFSTLLIVLLGISMVSAAVIIDPTVQDVVTFFSGNNTKFIQLTDTPNSYAGNAGNCTRVNSSVSGLEFIKCVDDGLNVTFDNMTITNLNVTGTVYVGSCIESEYELEFTDNAALPTSGNYLTLEGGINLGASYGRYIPFNSTILQYTAATGVTPTCTTPAVIELLINDVGVSNITFNTGTDFNSTDLNHDVTKGDNAALKMFQISCSPAPDDPIFTVRLKRRCV